MIERAVREREAGHGEEYGQQQHAHGGAGPQARDRIGRHQAEGQEQYPEAGAGGDAHDLVARRRERVTGGGHSGGDYEDAEQGRGEPHARIGYPECDHCYQDQARVTGKCRPDGQHLLQSARIARHDPVRLEDDERQEQQRGSSHRRDQRAERVDPMEGRRCHPCILLARSHGRTIAAARTPAGPPTALTWTGLTWTALT
jgi:hypothetical protein